jgi:septum formation protein
VKLILASTSPRRRQLLAEAGYQFDVVAPDETAECGICSREMPPEMVARLAMQKARDVAMRVDEGLIVGCDTLAECCGQILGKPHDRRHAREMLTLLRGRLHSVYSGVCLWCRPDDAVSVRVAQSQLRMDDFGEKQLEAYLDSGNWEGKAGAFGYQDGLEWLELVEGSESNVVGLPMELLAEMLSDFRLQISDFRLK